jgi:hypothetical protein
MALWSSTHEAPTFIMNSFATSTGNNRVFVCGQSRTGTPFSAQTRASALLRRNTSARRPFWFACHSTRCARAGLCETAARQRLRSNLGFMGEFYSRVIDLWRLRFPCMCSVMSADSCLTVSDRKPAPAFLLPDNF